MVQQPGPGENPRVFQQIRGQHIVEGKPIEAQRVQRDVQANRKASNKGGGKKQ